MADNQPVDIRQQGHSAGIAMGIVCGLVGYAVNGSGGAFAAAIAAYGAMRMLAFILHTLTAFIVSGLLLIIGAAMLAGYVGRAGKAMTRADDRTMNGNAIGANASASANGTARKLWFKNICRHPVRLFVKWQQPDGNWTVNGSWTVASDTSQFLGFGDGTQPQAMSPLIYVYAYVPDTTLEWRGDEQTLFNGKTLPIMPIAVNTSAVSYDFSMTCPGE